MKINRKNRARKSGLPVATAFLAILLLAPQIRAAEVAGDPAFEIGDGFIPPLPGSGDILGSEDIAGPDWGDIFDANGQILPDSEVSQAVFMQDDVSMGTAVDLTAVAESDALMVKNGIVEADQDIGHAYAALTLDSNGSMVILGAFERLGEGAGYVDFEFNQEYVRIGRGGFGKGLPWEVVGSQKQGDLLVRLSFADGQLAGVRAFSWEESESSESPLVEVGTVNGEGCNNEGSLCAVLNAQDIEAGPWLNADPLSDPTIIPAHRFVEFRVNVGELLEEQPNYRSVSILTSQDAAFGYFVEGN